MKDYHFEPNDPFSEIDIKKNLEKIENMSPIERRKSTKQSNFVQHMDKIQKQENQSRTRSWWKENWIQLLSLVFAFIAALPVIIQGISSILKYIK